ncbi:hypothetical protein G3N55_12565, partial [Dissulfurirhabdus thermomarina]
MEAVVVGRDGPHDLIAVRGEVLRALAETALPQGARILLEVVSTESPLQVRVVDTETGPPPAGDVRGLARELLGLRALLG